MTTEDKSQITMFSPEDEKETQKAPDHPRKNGTLKVAHKWTGFQGKTFWDWLQLLGVLAIPLVVAGATILFGIQQANLANQQHEADQHRAIDQQQATTLQTYIANIQDLLLNHNLLGDSPKTKNDADKVAIQEVQTLARSRTLTALQGLDGYRKGVLLNFLYEAKLIGYNNSDTQKNLNSIIDLTGADLTNADLTNADLTGTLQPHFFEATLR